MIRIGQKLQEERKIKRLSIEDVAKATKIRPEFLRAIEDGAYARLPSSAYAEGFIRNYAEFLGLPKKDFVALFRREYDEKTQVRVLPKSFARESEFPLKTIKIHQTILLILAFFFIVVGYIIFQYRYAFIPLPLTVVSPKENEVITAQEVKVSGKTDPSATVYINKLPVSVDNQGVFEKSIDVFPGKTTIHIIVVSHFGKKYSLDRTILIK